MGWILYLYRKDTVFINYGMLTILKLAIVRLHSRVRVQKKPIDFLDDTGVQKLNISVKIVSGVKQSGIPDTIKMSEAAGQYLWRFN